MKVTAVFKKLENLPFPKLMLTTKDNFIVFFNEEGKGTVVSLGNYKSDFLKVGQYHNDFIMKNFVDFKGTITIEQ